MMVTGVKRSWNWQVAMIGSKTTDECGDEWRRVHTTGNEYIRVGIVQETSTYECLEVKRRVHTTGDEYIRVPRGRRRAHTTGDEHIRVPRGQETSKDIISQEYAKLLKVQMKCFSYC